MDNKADILLELFKAKKLFSENSLKTTLVTMSPDKAIKAIQERGKNVITSGGYETMDAKAHSKAFTVANVMKADLVQACYNSVENAMKKGTPLKEFQADLVPRLQEMGWTGVTAGRLTVVYNTNVRMAYMQGTYQGMKLVSDFKPYYTYRQIERFSMNPDHTQFNGKKYFNDDPILQEIWPPGFYNCACSVFATDNPAGLENGEKMMDFVKDNVNFSIKPLQSWEPDTTKYNDKIRKVLDKILKTVKENKDNIELKTPKYISIELKKNPEVTTDFKVPTTVLNGRLTNIWSGLPFTIRAKYQNSLTSFKTWKDVPADLQTAILAIEKTLK